MNQTRNNDDMIITDGTITTAGCHSIGGIMTNEITNMHDIQTCHKNNLVFQIKELPPGTVCSQVIVNWKDPETGTAYSFPDPCNAPQVLDSHLGNVTDTALIQISNQIPPLKQIRLGVLPHDVKCRDGFVLVLKKVDNSPACIRMEHLAMLVQRGWGMPSMTQTCPEEKTMIDGQCVAIVSTTPAGTCKGDTLIPYSYALPCTRPNPTCPDGMTFSNGVCTTRPPYIPPPTHTPQCDPNTGICSSQGYANVSCGGAFSGDVCEPNSIACPTGLQGDIFGTSCNYSPAKCAIGYSAIKISAGSYSCQPTNPATLSNATKYFVGEKVGAFTISKINQNNVTGYYNNPYPLARPGLGSFTIMHIGDTLNPTCDGSAPLVITGINYPDSITVSIGKSNGRPLGGCPICLSADSMIRTPSGEINVKDIKDGMTVWSTDSDGTIIKSKVIKINNVFVGDRHKVIDLQLLDGRELFVSPNHPTYDGKTIADLKIGEIYDGSTVKSKELVPYKYQFTYDILPNSQTGNYFANGILVRSTLN